MTSIENNQPAVRVIKGPVGNIHTEISGEGGIPVVFLHSFGGNSKHWENQVRHLHDAHRVITVDLRGHGRSDSSSAFDYSVSSMAGDLTAVVDSLGLDQFVLVGHSMGGSIAIAYAAKNPNRVAGLILAGTPGRTPPEQSAPIISSLESGSYDTVMENYMKRLLTNATPATNSLERAGMKKLSRKTTISIIKSAFGYDPVPDLQKFKGPVIIVSIPEEDQSNSLHKAFPGIPYHVITGTSHWTQLDKPAEFNRIMDDFLLQVGSGQKMPNRK